MENLDELAAFICPEEVSNESADIEDFSIEDIVLADSTDSPTVLTNSQQFISNLLLEDLGNPSEEEEPVNSEEDDAIKIQTNGAIDLILSLAQYNRYLKIEKERIKSDINTKDIYIPTSTMIPKRNLSTNDSKQNNIYKFVETYINNTNSTDIHLFRLWITKKDAEFSQYDTNGLMRDTLSLLTRQRDMLYNLRQGEPEHLKSAINSFIETFTEVAGNRNKIMERFRLSKDPELYNLIEELDSFFDNSSSYYNKPIVQIEDIILLHGKDTSDQLESLYTIAKSIYAKSTYGGETSEIFVECTCGAHVSYKDNIQLYQKKGVPYIKARYSNCPNCGKKIILHRNVLFALEQVLLKSKEQVRTFKNQVTVMYVGKDELSEAHGYLSANRTQTYILNGINPEINVVTKEFKLSRSEREDFINSFLNVLEIQTLKHMDNEVQYHVMQYLCNLNGLSMKISSLVTYFYNSYVSDEVTSLGEVKRYQLNSSNEKKLQQTLKKLSKNKALSSYIVSDINLGSKYLNKRFTKSPEIPPIDEAFIFHLREEVLKGISSITFEEYVELSSQKVDPVLLHLTGIGKFLESLITEPAVYADICSRMFEIMISYHLKKQPTILKLPMETKITKEIANKLIKVLRDIRTLKSFEEFNAATVFNILGTRMEDIMLVASNECKRLNCPIYDQYLPPLELTLPGKFGTYLLYLTFIGNSHDLKNNYLRLRVDAPNPWENSMEKSILLYALLITFKNETADPEEAELIIQLLEETGEQLCLVSQ